ncbi:hypothetical protein ACHAXT_007657 [Thalassiosira profunda]
MAAPILRGAVLVCLAAAGTMSAVDAAFVPPPSSPSGGRSTVDVSAVTSTTSLMAHHPQHPPSHRRAFLAASLTSALPTLITPDPAAAISPDQASQSYDRYAPSYDALDGGSAASSLGIDAARAKLLQRAKGNVLEVGVGTGLNLQSYDFDRISSLTVVDVSEGMLSQARERAREMQRAGKMGATKIEFAKADATSELISLFGEGKFDTVVDTFSLCVMGNAGARRCLEQMAGVAKTGEDGGQILLIENTRASNPLLGAYQDLTASAAADVGGKGCVYNQNVGEMIRQTRGLELVEEEAFAAGLFRSFVCQKR